MGKAVRKKIVDNRTPKHSNDAARPSKGSKDRRDAATVSFFGRSFSAHVHSVFGVVVLLQALMLPQSNQ